MNQDRVSQTDDREQIDREIDWLAWVLQLGAGILVGFGVGYFIARLFFRSSLADLNQMFLIMVGVSLCCGAFTSFYGNKAWMAPSVFLKPEPIPPRTARTCSRLIGLAGAVLVLLPIIWHFNTLGEPAHMQRFGGSNLFALLAAVVFAFLLLHALRAGKVFWSFGAIEREESPLR